ncbi:DUF2934 domain-containing protein [Aureimonas phyllosphaerae]|uniref:DUF2934 domain-containing protein n=1 Tax=Aureimonas phyllosphaerae TaxID=1166078 RepID=A0A7W6BLJ6_9HYPH|nr:DUF2934 domain-containing protein [Aureimonas phyllosphaerae]MBB3934223.1 hypothetical protein [Aureimonas phyllosphaerae]MBB3958561.1 hypothetical protein [Aureimonas phyllosphaerae]SFE98893.1 Protein of unknown function [Aureimonas phyllosphaerae]
MLKLFRKEGDIVTLCAVPEASDLPDFLSGDEWVFAGQSADIAEKLAEPDRATYRAVLSETGFYLFSPAQTADAEDDSHIDLEPLVKERAYFLWEEAGCPLGREHEFWAAASREIEADVRARFERRHAGRHIAR